MQGNRITVEGPEAELVAGSSTSWCSCSRRARALDDAKVSRTIDMVREDLRPSEVLGSEVVRAAKGQHDPPEHGGAEALLRRHRRTNIITFGIGPAGTASRYLAVAQAVQALQSRQVNRIILTRPAVEAGERLGFLPGDLMAKVDPYLRPLYDALYDLLEPEGAQRLLERGPSRWRRSPSCGVGRSTTRSSSWTRPRTPRPSR